MFHLGILDELPEPDDLRQLFIIVPGVESPGLRLHQRRLTSV
jgi:hypothetical protein